MFRTICLLLLLANAVVAGEITTIAGTGEPGNNGAQGLAVETNVGEPFGVELGPDGALYITEVRNHRVRRLDLKSGDLTTVAGNGSQGYEGDGLTATKAKLNEPYEVRFNSAGTMFFVEMKNHLIRTVDSASGDIHTFSGRGREGNTPVAPRLESEFRQPHSIAFDDADNLYIADIGNHRICRVNKRTGIVEAIAGTGEKQLPKEGEISRRRPVLGPRSLAVHGQTLWVCLREGNSVWQLDLKSLVWRHVAGTGKKGFTGDGGIAKEATFDGPKGIALGPDGSIYIADTENHAIRKIDAKTSIITTIAGTGPQGKGELGDGGDATKARLARPHGVCVGPDGVVYIGDSNHHRVRRVAP